MTAMITHRAQDKKRKYEMCMIVQQTSLPVSREGVSGSDTALLSIQPLPFLSKGQGRHNFKRQR